MPPISVALQLYTVRDALSKDYVGTLKKVKEIGYDAVQLTGVFPYDAPKTRGILDELGLQAAGCHIALEELESDVGKWIEFCQVLGTRDVVCPYLPDERRGSLDDWLKTALLLDQIGAQCREKGARLSYHNHSFEFVKFNGRYALDLLYEHTSPAHLYAEIDTYWVKHGGEEPRDFIRKYSGRIPILHVKDMASDEERSFAEVGSGILDWPAIHRAAVQAGVECYCVEQDTCKRDPLESAAMSLDYVSKLVSGRC